MIVLSSWPQLDWMSELKTIMQNVHVNSLCKLDTCGYNNNVT